MNDVAARLLVRPLVMNAQRLDVLPLPACRDPAQQVHWRAEPAGHADVADRLERE
jgi:hypothetical protein